MRYISHDAVAASAVVLTEDTRSYNKARHSHHRGKLAVNISS